MDSWFYIFFVLTKTNKKIDNFWKYFVKSCQSGISRKTWQQHRLVGPPVTKPWKYCKILGPKLLWNLVSHDVKVHWKSRQIATSFTDIKQFTRQFNEFYWIISGVTVGGHPLDLAKTLIQVGHEPLAPKHTKTWMGKPKLSLPSVFLYMGHIRRQDGFFGLYRGLGPKLVTMGVSSVVSDQFAQHWPKSKCKNSFIYKFFSWNQSCQLPNSAKPVMISRIFPTK